MKVVIRVDASVQIGIGHVMRCLTLAATLRRDGADVIFISRAHTGNLIKFIQEKGFKTFILKGVEDLSSSENTLQHSEWLGVSQQKDAEQCRLVLEEVRADWLIVDHYSIDQFWEDSLKGFYKKLMVIDDLADRNHVCDILLDQTFGRSREDYLNLVPKRSKLLMGARYALLRPEFEQWRDYSLKRRLNQKVKRILIAMGGVDSDNITEQVLCSIQNSNLRNDIEIIVVMGGTAPHLNAVKEQANRMSFKTDVVVNVSNMAEIISNSDLGIGAAGATTWERCCLGLPSIMFVLAQNQRKIASLVAEEGAAIIVDKVDMDNLYLSICLAENQLASLTSRASNISDGQGVGRVLGQII